ncbi:MAG: ComF family protein [Pseudomonadota bacterium]
MSQSASNHDDTDDAGRVVTSPQLLARRAVRVARSVVFEAARQTADFLVPPVCISCRTPLTRHHALCPSCWINVDFVRAPICDVLGTPLPFATGRLTVSAAALAAPPVYDRARSVAHHTDVMRRLIHGLKYGDRTDGVATFGKWLAIAAQDFADETDLIIPVPLNRWRLWSRRFNQAALLAHALARETGWPIDTRALDRVRRTRSQVGLTANQRRTNVSGAFRVPPRARNTIRGSSVLLVDDVLTTGATLNAAARTLKTAGAARVNVVTLARVVAPVQPTL